VLRVVLATMVVLVLLSWISMSLGCGAVVMGSVLARLLIRHES
jgi:type IV secretory pathway TrbD component